MKDQKPAAGFTLIEILVVVAILAILVSVAIPQFFAYRARAIDARLHSDLKNAALAMESYYAVNHKYTNSIPALNASGFVPSVGTALTVVLPNLSSYTITATAPGGTQPSFTFDSVTGVIN